jgi:hypothetical protein
MIDLQLKLLEEGLRLPPLKRDSRDLLFIYILHPTQMINSATKTHVNSKHSQGSVEGIVEGERTKAGTVPVEVGA